MSIIIGAVIGLLICWYAQKTLGLELKGHSTQTPAADTSIMNSGTAHSVPREKPEILTEPSAVSKQPASGKAIKDAAQPAGQRGRINAQEKDDLKKIGGIGPKIAEILNKEGVITFRQLSKKKPSELKSILDKAGSRYRPSDFSSWAKQAEYAAKGDWKSAKAVWARSK